MDEKFCLFLETVDDRYRDFVNQIHAYLTEKGCKCKIQTAKSGYTVSYVFNNNRTFATFLSRKAGMKLRIYPKQLQKYQEFLDTFPEKMKEEIKKSSVCKRLVNPDECNPKCVMGYAFIMDGEPYQKCRHMAFQPTLSEENNPFLLRFLEYELENSC